MRWRGCPRRGAPTTGGSGGDSCAATLHQALDEPPVFEGGALSRAGVLSGAGAFSGAGALSDRRAADGVHAVDPLSRPRRARPKPPINLGPG